MADLKLSTADNITDPVNDMIVADYSTMSWTSTRLHPELDIDTMIRSNQDFTITFHNTLHTEANYSYQFQIYELNGDSDTGYIVRLYGASAGYLAGPEGYWNGTGWSLYDIPVSVGTISGNKVEIGIPSEALIIQSPLNWAFIAMFSNYSVNKTYIDLCPNEIRDKMLGGFSGPERAAIYGYEFPIVLGVTLIFAIILIYTYEKQLKYRFTSNFK